MKKTDFSGYSKYGYKNKNYKSAKKGKFFSVFCAIIAIVVIAFFSISFSNFLIIGKVVNINSNHIVNSKLLYGISLESHSTYKECEASIESYVKQGTAGHIFKCNNEYKILSSIYKTKKDAESVKNNLLKVGQEAEVIEIVLPSINLKTSLTTKSREALTSALDVFYESYLNLYEMSIQYDKQEIDIIKVKSLTKSYIESNTKILNDFTKYFSISSNACILYIKIHIQHVNNVLNKIVNCDISQNFSSLIKSSYCQIVETYIDLSEEIL